MKLHSYLLAAFAAFALFATSCGGGSRFASHPPSSRTDSIELSNLNPQASGGGYYSLETDVGDSGATLTVRANREVSGGHLLHIEYDAAKLTPSRIEFADEFLTEKYLTLAVTNKPGIVAIGVAPIGGGETAPGVVATIEFEPAAFAARAISAAPSGSVNVVNDLKVERVADGEARLIWHGKLAGDYDLSGLVGVPDITPIALHYLETSETTEDFELFRIIDGDGDGVVGIPDITVIALHYLESLIGYRVFRGVPTDPLTPGAPINWLSLPLEVATEGDTTLAVRPEGRYPEEGFLFFDVAAQVEPAFLNEPSAWRVVPIGGEAEGVPSQPFILIPEIVRLAEVPPQAITQLGTMDVTNADIAVAPGPGGSAPFESGAPLIASRDSDGKLVLHYYLDGWQEQVILDDGRTFTSPAIEIIGGKIFIAISDRTDGEVKLFAGLPGELFEEYSATGALQSPPSLLRLDYSAQDDAVLLAFTRDPLLGEAVVNFARATLLEDLSNLDWTLEEVYSAPAIAGLDLCVNRDASEIALAFSAGTFDSQNLSASTNLFRATKAAAAEAFDVQDVSVAASGAVPLLVSCDYIDGGLEILYQHFRLFTIPFTAITVPILDIKVYRGGDSPIDSTLVTGSITIVNPFTITVSIKYGIEPEICALRGHPSKSAFAAVSSASGQLVLANFPVITGSVQLGVETASQTGASFSALTSRGAGRGFSASYSAEIGAVQACYIETEPIDVSTLGGLQNLPAGPLYFNAFSP